MKDDNHISQNLIEEYALWQLYPGLSPDFDEQTLMKIEEHIAECDQCAQKANHVYTQFAALDQWDLFQDNQNILQKRVLSALKTFVAQGVDQNTATRIKRWIDDFKGLSGGAFQLFMNLSAKGRRKTSRFLTEVCNGLKEKAGLDFDYSYELVPGRNGETEKIMKLTEIKAEHDEKPVKINLSRKKEEVRVVMESGRDEELPMAMLLPISQEQSPRLSTPIWNEEIEKWEIVFKDIPEGTFYFLFEPGIWK